MRFNKFVLSFLLVAAVAFVAASAVVARKRAAETMWESRVTQSVTLSVEYIGDEDNEAEENEGELDETPAADDTEVRASNFNDYAFFVVITPSGSRYTASHPVGNASISFPEAFIYDRTKLENGRHKWMCFVEDKAVASGQFDFQPTDTLDDQSLTAYEIEQERQRLIEQRTSKPAGQIGTGANDGWLWTKVRAALAATDGLRDSTINVNVDNGVVTLSGSVGDDAQKARASSIAASVSGVKSVRNSLTVSR